MKMKRILLSVVAVAATVAAAPFARDAADRAANPDRIDANHALRLQGRQERIGEYTNTRNHQSFAALTVDGRKLLFVGVIAGSGAKYVADQYNTWWTKGPQGNLYDEMAAKDSPPLLADCQAPRK